MNRHLPPIDKTPAQLAWERARRLQSISEAKFDANEREREAREQPQKGAVRLRDVTGPGIAQPQPEPAPAPPPQPESLAAHVRRKAFEE